MDKYELYYKVAQSKLVDQDDRDRQINLRATGVMAVGTTLVGFVALTLGNWPGWALPLAAMTLLFWAVESALVLSVVRTRDWHRSPKFDELDKYVDQYEVDGLTLWVSRAVGASYTNNEQIIDLKSRRLNYAMYGLVGQALSFGVTLILVQADAIY